MRILTTSALVLVLAACGNDRQATTTNAANPNTAPQPARSGPTLADLVDSADVDDGLFHEAEGLHGTVAVYLVTRMGSVAGGTQRADLSVVLVSDHGAMRVELPSREIPISAQFGTMIAAAPFPSRPFDPARDAFGGALPWTSPDPVLLATRLVDDLGQVHAYVLTRREQRLQLHHTHSTAAAQGEDSWFVEKEITLADDAIVTLPEPWIAAHEREPVPVRLQERVGQDLRGVRLEVASLRVGERSGPLRYEEVTSELDQPWSFGPLPRMMAPPRGEILASRLYVLGSTANARVLAHDGDDLVLWRSDAAGPWSAEVRVPLPPGATIDLH